jgi:lysine 2,3-aminomutase
MKEKISPFLKSISDSKYIRMQYYISEHENNQSYNDPLMEEEHEVVKGLIHKYGNRALIKTSYLCASHCRFCTRIRQIGNPEGTLTEKNIDYISKNSQIEDVILSGGDPFYTPKITEYLLLKLNDISSIKVIRIGTRMPFQSPKSFQSKTLSRLLNLIDKIGKQKPFYILVHIEHPDELKEDSIQALKILKQLKVTLLSQTVFLANINDNFQTLYKLFTELYFLGIIPYYLYHCDNVKGLEHFRGDKKKEKEISNKLREKLSGIATPLFVEDIESGYGKIPI